MIAVDKNKELCCGCEACVQKCPVNCIAMEQDEEGFQYPYIDETKCVHCDACEKVCPVLMNKKFDAVQEEVYSDPIAYGGWHRDEKVRENSSSGGAFTLFADEVMRKNGIVYGAAFKDSCTVLMCRSDLRRISHACMVLNMYRATCMKFIQKYRKT